MYSGYEQKQRPLPSHRKGPFSMYTDTVTIQRVSIPRSRMCSFTASMDTSFDGRYLRPKLLPHRSFQRAAPVVFYLDSLGGFQPSPFMEVKVYHHFCHTISKITLIYHIITIVGLFNSWLNTRGIKAESRLI